MTELLKKAIASVRGLTAGEQDEVARMILAMTDQEPPGSIDPEHLSGVLEGLKQAKRRELTTDEEVAAVLRRFDE